MGAIDPVSPVSSVPSANHGTAATTASHVEAGHAAAVDPDARERVHPDVSAARLDVAPRGDRVHLVERRGGQRDRGVRPAAAEHPREHLDKRRRRRLAGRFVQRRHRQWLPQPFAEAPALSVPGEPL
jgi:hypothetical protein